MQRRTKLIRKLMECVEMSQTEDTIPIPEIEGYSEAQVHYHTGLCKEAGYMIVCQPGFDGPGRRFPGIVRLTWAGHETLDNMRTKGTIQ